ncbi:hypothetical protein Hamer_G021125 [Homarus americanus]|uniref:Uncharacterized protein n=1 Tax=Homarus americanus TaxID=6706 RepID=A0A8J5JER1_HOMAM|nr:hypothetical protein Hamer_G021125 [Homarus americanus]
MRMDQVSITIVVVCGAGSQASDHCEYKDEQLSCLWIEVESPEIHTVNGNKPASDDDNSDPGGRPITADHKCTNRYPKSHQEETNEVNRTLPLCAKRRSQLQNTINLKKVKLKSSNIRQEKIILEVREDQNREQKLNFGSIEDQDLTTRRPNSRQQKWEIVRTEDLNLVNKGSHHG